MCVWGVAWGWGCSDMQALHVPAASIPAAMAADNLLMAFFLAALMAVPLQRAALTATATTTTASATATTTATINVAKICYRTATKTTTSHTTSTAATAKTTANMAIATAMITAIAPTAFVTLTTTAAAVATRGTSHEQHDCSDGRAPLSRPGSSGGAREGCEESGVQGREDGGEWTDGKSPGGGGSSLEAVVTDPPSATAESLSMTLAAAATACAAAEHLARALGVVPLTMLILAAVAAVLAAVAQWLQAAVVDSGKGVAGEAGRPMFAGGFASCGRLGFSTPLPSS